MTFPVDYFYISAPGFSYAGNMPWPSGSGLSSQFQNACSNYEAAAKAALDATLAEGWISTGQTYSGAAAPALPSEESSYAGCGSGQRNTVALIGDAGFFGIKINFFAKKLKKEFRWIQDKSYTPAGTYYRAIPGREHATPAWDEIAGAQATFTSVTSSVLGSMADTYEFTNEDTFYFKTSNWSSGAALRDSLLSALNVATPITYMTTQPTPWAIMGSGALGMWINAALAWYGFLIDSVTLAAQNGQWHLESRYVLDSPAQQCSSAIYIQDSRHLGDGTGGDRASSTSNALAAMMPNIEGNGTITLGNPCQPGTVVKGADVLDPALTQALLDQLNAGSNPYVLEGAYHPAVEFSFTIPGGLVAIEAGSPLLGYNTRKGALVYDMELNKWGKWKQDYTVLVEFNGLNNANAQSFQYTDLGMTAGLLHDDGKIYLFDQNPVDSWIRYGKIGYYRLGHTHWLEARVDFRSYSSGVITLDYSMDGRNIDLSLQNAYNYVSKLTERMYPNQSSRWQTITVSGNYDIQYMEVRGNISGRR